MLTLPAFLRPMGEGSAGPSSAERGVTIQDVAAGFALTGYFLNDRVLEPIGARLPDSRDRLIASL